MRCRGLLILLLVVLVPSAVGGDEEEKEFRRRVDAAITKGCQNLVATQQADGAWQSPYNAKYPEGATALCLLALLVSEHNPWAETVTKAMDRILAHKFERTYSAAIAMMAIEARAIPPEEFKAMREGKPIKRFVRKLPAAHKAFMKRHVEMLLAGRLHEAWGYPKGPDFSGDWGGDLSNTQYALLGFKSASRCGIRVDDDDWMRILRIVLNAQERKGPKVRLIINKTVDKNGYVSVETRPAEVRGWRYAWPYSVGANQTVNPGPDDKPSGSMTTAGISCLAILHSELRKCRRYRNKMRDVSQAIDGGFAWLQENWAVEKNPGGNPAWHYYYLYGLERAGVLAGRKWIGPHDWYREGAEYLLARQGGGGGWPGGILDTAFALLFLKRSTTPVTLTGLHR